MNEVTRATPLAAFGDVAVPVDLGRTELACQPELSRQSAAHLTLRIHDDLGAVESEWRGFEARADCTAFQTFDYLATWQRHIGARRGVIPVVAVGSYADGETAFILPLAVEPTRYLGRRLCWLGQDLCDYNAPLLARDFAERVTPDGFRAAWHELRERIAAEARLRPDWIVFEQMPQTVGTQLNPFTHLDVTPNASGAHLTQLGADWQKFYTDKRSSATRRRDRAKRRHMSQFGDIGFVTATDLDDIRQTLHTLMEQKSRSFGRRGIADIFARPGCREFFLDLASNPKMRHAVHVSRVEIGGSCAAANLGILFGDCYYHVLASYGDGEAAHYGPGALHLRELLAYAIGAGLRRFDFTIGDEPYKLEWADTHLKLCDYTAAATWRGRPAAAVSIARLRLKRFIKQTPLAWRVVSRVRAARGALLHPAELRPTRPLAATTSTAPPALACVMGDMDLLAPIAAAGIPCAVVTRPGVPSLYSRFARARLTWDDFSNDQAELLDALVGFGTAQAERPVLFYEEDAQLLTISRHRERLAPAFRFAVAEATLVEDLLDKARFQILAERHGLPVPPACRFDPAALEPADLGLRFPVIIKPLIRLARWDARFGLRKALAAENPEALRKLRPRLAALDIELVAQELIAGPETRLESYHCYVDRERGDIVAEFTGRKLRTLPASYGHTTALEITDATDVQRLGRATVERLGLTGVAKLDFKRDRRGKLHLLEVNPRFSLWHHAGAAAGVNIPALVYADLVGLPRPAAARAKPGVRWCRVWRDFPAAKASGMPLRTWLQWVWRCEAKSALSWRDPMPVLRASLHRLMARHDGQASEGFRRARNQSGS